MLRSLTFLTLSLLLATFTSTVYAEPVELFNSFAGNIDFVSTGGTLRQQSNAGDSCDVGANNGTVVSTANLNGIPAGSTVTAAYLYWTGSGPTSDLTVNFNGSTISSDRNFTENYSIGTISLDFFSGFKDVTPLVTGNGNYSFSGLVVEDNDIGGGGIYCSVAAVVAGWGLFVIYENTSTEPLRVVNVFDGFQAFRGTSITLTPNNFQVPASTVDGKLGILSWEGDEGNSAIFNGNTENLTFDGQNTPSVFLTDGFNPINNQFNSTINTLGSNTTYGVDLDTYDVSSYLTAGDTSANTVYSSGGDLVLLSAEVISVTNTPVADLAISKSSSGSAPAGGTVDYTISVTNNGPNTDTNTITVADSLPATLTYVNGTGTGWSCSAVLQDVTCTHPGPLPSGNALPDLTLQVLLDNAASGNIVNTATVSSASFDNVSTNDSNPDTLSVMAGTAISLQKTNQTIFDPINNTNNPKAIPGSIVRYTITAVNNGTGVTDNDSVIIADPLPSNARLVLGTLPIQFTDGSVNSGLSFNYTSLGDNSDDIEFSNDGGASYTTPVVDTNGVDITSPPINYIRINPKGVFNATNLSGAPSFSVAFDIKVN